MPCSPERLAANRRNARKSTGPRTAEGKLASRRNSCKHGLTGEGVVVPEEDAAEVEARVASFGVALRPRDDVARFLARRAAVLSVRMDRCVREESARLAVRAIAAAGDEEEARIAGVEGHWLALAADPARSVRHLRRSPEGIDRLVAAWQGLRAALVADDPGAWTPAHAGRVALLLGRDPEEAQDEAPGPEERAGIAGLIDAEVDRLHADRAALDLGAIARARAAAPDRALVDASPDGERLRKYEAAAERGFYKALREIERINAGPDEGDATDCPDGTSAEVGSIDPAAPPDPAPVDDEPAEPAPPPPPRSMPPSIPAAPALERVAVVHLTEPVAFYPPIRE